MKDCFERNKQREMGKVKCAKWHGQSEMGKVFWSPLIILYSCDDKDLDEVAHAICIEYSLNRKQKVAFELAISNGIKRVCKDTTQQIIGYIGGPRQEKVKSLKL